MCLPLFWSTAHAEEGGKFDYCGHLSFYIPAYFDKQSLVKQGKLDSCKNGFTLKSNSLKRTVDITFSNQYAGANDVADEKFLDQFKANFPQRLHYVISYKTPNDNGLATIITFYWLDNKGSVKRIEKMFFFAKEASMTATASYTANPNDPNDILFMNALEQLFLSAEIDW